jgi:Protein of unknown function (DUF3238)
MSFTAISTAIAIGLALPSSTLDLGRGLPEVTSIPFAASTSIYESASLLLPTATPQLLAQSNTPRRIKVWVKSFIPQSMVDGPPGFKCFLGDNRGFSNSINISARGHQEVEFDVATLSKTLEWQETGTTHQVNCQTGAILKQKKASKSGLRSALIRRSGNEILVTFQGAINNPVVPGSPDIDLNVTFRINPVTRQAVLIGEHDGFPAYEAYITADGGAGVPVYQYDPRLTRDGISALFPPMERKVRGYVTRF